jgi:hypothetical protein
MLNGLAHDLRYAARVIRRNAVFAAGVVASLALGGANTAMFNLLDAVRLRALPIAAPDELVDIRLQDRTHARGTWSCARTG